MTTNRAAVEIPGLDVPKAKRYSRTRLTVLLVGTAFSVAKLTWFALSGRSGRLRLATRARVPDPRLATPAYVAVVAVLSWLSSLPLGYLGGLRIERRFELSKQSDRGWLLDQVKGLVLGLALQVPAVTGVYWMIRRRPRDWWAWLAAAVVPAAAILSSLAPVLIMPIFNRFETLRDETLRARVRGLAARAGVPIADVFQMDMSRQSEKPNAFFTGLGTTKRIVLSDTLIDRFEPTEIDAVVAHELGHQVHGDIWRLIALTGGLGFGAAYAVHRLAPPLVRRTARRSGVEDIADEASLPLLSLVMILIGFAASPIQGAFGRAIERRTDRYAMRLTNDGRAYGSTMRRLASLALADPDPPAAVVFFLYGHPPIAERIAAAEAFERSRSAAAETGPISTAKGLSAATAVR